MKLQDLFIPRLRDVTGSPLARVGIKPGLFHFQRDVDGVPLRFHLRVDSTGNGLLVANAAAAARLRPSGVIIAKAILEGKQDSAIALQLQTAFRGVTVEQAAADVHRVRAIVADLESPGDNYPILNLADPAYAPTEAPLDRPLSADVPMAEPERIVPLVDRLWELAIPHVTFIANEQTDPRWLLRAVERTEDHGMIAGLRIRGTDLMQGTLLADLVMAGIDHVDVLYLSHDPAIHDALTVSGDHAQAARALAEVHNLEVCAVAEIALVESNLDTIEETIDALLARDVTSAVMFAIAATQKIDGPLSAGAVVQAAVLVEEAAEEHGLRLMWYPPVRFDASISLAEEIRRGPRASGDSAIRVEPDGTVIPGRGPWISAGNLMTEDWQSIANHPGYRAYRWRVENDTHCDTCPGLATCAADCPRDPSGWADNRRVVETHE